MSDPIPHISVVIIGAGGTGLAAALAATDLGAEVVVIERDRTPLGSTAMSTGLIPAAGTPEQAAAGIKDSPELLALDIMSKTKGRADPAMALNIARESADTIAWLRDTHQIPLELVDGFLYPGHSVRRMYGTPMRSGGELMGALQSACEAAGVMLVTQATVTQLHARDGVVNGVTYRYPDGSEERINCDAVILACSGFGGNAEMVANYIPEISGAVFHGHPGNQGDAVRWGRELGAQLADMSAYQGHGGLAAGHGIPILWPLIMEGGFQVNANGERFSNEALGYSEQAANVNAQPGGVAWSIFDERLHNLMDAFEDYKVALSAGAVTKADTIEELAAALRLPADALSKTVAEVAACVEAGEPDRFGRKFAERPVLTAPFYAAKVTGALFHTQGGLMVDDHCRVLREDGTPIENLYAGGGAARGLSGGAASGYMAGNGLLAATTMGKIAGRHAARTIAQG